jgi:hypothetical protein
MWGNHIFIAPDLEAKIIKEIAAKLGLEFVPEKEAEGNVCLANSSEVRDDYRTTFAPIDLLDYIYAVLHSPTYREKYKAFLKIDSPRVPYPKDSATFWKLVHLGNQIRRIHLLESPVVEQFITQYPVNGDNVVTKPRFFLNEAAPVVIQNDAKQSEESPDNRDSSSVGMTTQPAVIQNEAKPSEESFDQPALIGKVYINDSQYFDNVPQVAWEFYTGGYQPAQKWLKDRKGRALEFDDILHWQKIIVALTETDRLMREIDGIELEN